MMKPNTTINRVGYIRKTSHCTFIHHFLKVIGFNFFSIDNCFKYTSSRYTKNIRKNRGKFDVRILKYLVNTILFRGDRKSTRLNSSHVAISYAVFCLKKKKLSVECTTTITA